jgi:hypothetical protein
MGFGHRVYKNYDPRAKIIKKMADQVFEVTGRNPLLDIALELEKIALNDEYFIKRKLYPNVDFYSGLIYQAMGFPVEMFPVLFAIPRTAGWLCPVAGDARRQRAEDRPPAPDLHRRRRAQLRADQPALRRQPSPWSRRSGPDRRLSSSCMARCRLALCDPRSEANSACRRCWP